MARWSPSGHVDVVEFLETLEVDNIRPEGHDEIRFSCPYPGHDNGDASASAYMNTETTQWYCHGCKRKGDAVSMCSSIWSISPMKARGLLRQAYDPSSLDPDQRSMVREIQKIFAAHQEKRVDDRVNEAFDESHLDDFAVDWDAVEEAIQEESDVPEGFDYMFSRGFTAETLNHWDFGYDYQTGRITFAIRNEHGQLIGFKARSIDGRHPKYLVLGDGKGSDRYGFPRYYTGSVIFGLDKAIALGHKTLIVCEGELNAIALWQMGITNAVALNGSRLTDDHRRLLKRYADEVIFFFDEDTAGENGVWGHHDEDDVWHPGAMEILSKDIKVAVVGPHEDDAAQYLEDGDIAICKTVVASKQSFLVARLSRVK